MKTLSVILLTILILTGISQAASPQAGSSAAGFFDATFGDLPEELQTAQKQGKKGVMLFFEEDD